MKPHILIAVAFCLPVPVTSQGAAESPFTRLAQAETTGAASPNALDAQDRIRAREAEKARSDVRRRLGDRIPEPAPHNEDFTAPGTHASPKPNPNEKL
jgi:hypothetical protein